MPELTVEDLLAARQYAQSHAQEIERCLWENDACMVEHDGLNIPHDLLRRGRDLGLSPNEIREAFEPSLSREAVQSLLAALEV